MTTIPHSTIKNKMVQLSFRYGVIGITRQCFIYIRYISAILQSFDRNGLTSCYNYLNIWFSNLLIMSISVKRLFQKRVIRTKFHIHVFIMKRSSDGQRFYRYQQIRVITNYRTPNNLTKGKSKLISI